MGKAEDFISKIAPVVQELAPKYGIGCCSAVIAQACLESAYGTSNKAKYHNYFGLKHRTGRVACSSGYFTDESSEQLTNGKYVKIQTTWFKFASVEKGIEGYFQFTDTANYANLKGASNPETYLRNIRDDGYATSLDYVDNCMAIVNKYNLTQYDPKGDESVTAPKITKMISKYNNSSRNGNPIKYIVIHYTGNTTDTAKANANYFATGNRNASAHYFVDKSYIYQSVEDSKAAWHVGVNYGRNNLFGKCTNRNSIGIEMCSDCGMIANATYKRVVELTKYLMDKYNVPASRVVRHYDVCSKRCPGWKGWIPSDESKWKQFKKDIAGNQSEDVSKPSTDNKVDVKDRCVKALQTALNSSYGLSLAVDGSFGPKTQAAVDEHYLYYNPVRILLRNAHVSWLQTELNKHGAKLTVDGLFGKNTQKAVKNFQKKYGLEVDGYAGVKTHWKLISLI